LTWRNAPALPIPASRSTSANARVASGKSGRSVEDWHQVDDDQIQETEVQVY